MMDMVQEQKKQELRNELLAAHAAVVVACVEMKALAPDIVVPDPGLQQVTYNGRYVSHQDRVAALFSCRDRAHEKLLSALNRHAALEYRLKEMEAA